MTKISLLLATGAASALAACFGGGDDVVIDEPGPRTEQTRDVASFDEIEVAGPYNVIVADGEPSALTISGPENVLQHTEFKVEDGELTIRMKKGYRTKWRWSDDEGIEIHLSHNALKGAGIAGSGSIDIARSKVDDFEGEIAGSGDLTIRALEAGRADFGIAGSGDMRVSGTVDRMNLDIAGSGNFESSGLESVDAEISIAGSGDVDTRVTGEAEVSIVGSGDVNLTGGAKCSISKVGSGDVTCS